LSRSNRLVGHTRGDALLLTVADDGTTRLRDAYGGERLCTRGSNSRLPDGVERITQRRC
jgi:hypothetical protein